MNALAWPPDIRTIGDVVARNARDHADKIALISVDGRSTTFACFAEHIAALAAMLALRGLTKGDRVAVLSRNRPEYLEAVCLCAMGFVAVPLNWRLSPGELLTILQDAGPSAIFADRRGVAVIEDLGSAGLRIPHRFTFDEPASGWDDYSSIIATPSQKPDLATAPDDTACIVYTSGTTGAPKGAELVHGALLQNARAAIDHTLGLAQDDVTLAAMPFFHVGGLWYHLFPSFVAGCTNVVLGEFDPGEVLGTIARHRITNMHVVPTMLHALNEHPSALTTDLSSLRLVFYAASSIPLTVLQRAMVTFPTCGFVQGYGSTEAGTVTCLSAEDHRCATASPERAGILLSCGKALPGVEIRLVDSFIDPELGEIGEISVRSSMVMERYWRNPAATRLSRDADGFLRTGDLGRFDAQGHLYILDRRNDMIVTGGENVYPREVEDVLGANCAIAEVAVFDMPDDKWVQKVVAAVVLREGARASSADIIAEARSRLAAYKCPKHVFIVDTLPRNGAGKVLRKHLRIAFGRDDLEQKARS